MIDDKIDDTLVALSRAFSLETHEVYRKAILRLIEERYPDSLYVHFCRAELNPGDELKVQSLMQAVRQRQGEIDPARVAQRPVNKSGIQHEVIAYMARKCGDYLVRLGNWSAASELYARSVAADPETASYVKWKRVIVLINSGRDDEARDIGGESDFKLGDIANKLLLDLRKAKNASEMKEIADELRARNRFLFEFLTGQKRLPVTFKKGSSKTYYEGSKSEALMYLEFGLSAWEVSPMAIAGLLGIELSETMLEKSLHRAIKAEPISLTEDPPTLEAFKKIVSGFSFSRPDLVHRMSVVKNTRLWAEFFVLARRWWECRVWETVGAQTPFFLNPQTLGARFAKSEPYLICTMGNLGRSFGVSMFDSEADYDKMALAESGKGQASATAAFGFSAIHFEYAPLSELSELSRCLATAFKIEPLGAQKLIPEITRSRAGWEPCLPVEGRLLELMSAIQTSLFFHDPIKQGLGPWANQPKNAAFVSSVPCPNLVPWGEIVDIKEPAETPLRHGGGFDHSELVAALASSPRNGSEWQVGWSYLRSRIEGSAANPGVIAAIMLVIDRASRMVLSMQLIDAGDSLSAKMAQAIADAARTTGTRPKKIVVLDSINCDQFKPIFKSADISLEQTSSLPIFFALVNELSDSMRNGELGKN